MDTRTGAIAQFEKDSDAKRAGFDLKLTADQTKQLLPMSRKARRAWVSSSRKKNKRG